MNTKQNNSNKNKGIFMQCSTEKAAINKAAMTVRDASYKAKQELTREQLVDELLDSILEVKQYLQSQIKLISKHTESLEEITWYDPSMFDEETKKKINDVISSSNDWAESLTKYYLKWKDVSKKIVPSDLAEFYSAVLDLKDAAKDLETAVFDFPNDPEMEKVKELIKNL